MAYTSIESAGWESGADMITGDALDELLEASGLDVSQSDLSKVGTLFAGIPTSQDVPANGTLVLNVGVKDPFRPDRLILSTAAQALDIIDIRVGTRSQNTGTGTIPGEVFANDTTYVRINGDTAQPGVGIDITFANTTVAAITPSGTFVGKAAQP
jgi:hypothetical protein